MDTDTPEWMLCLQASELCAAIHFIGMYEFPQLMPQKKLLSHHPNQKLDCTEIKFEIGLFFISLIRLQIKYCICKTIAAKHRHAIIIFVRKHHFYGDMPCDCSTIRYKYEISKPSNDPSTDI